MIYRCAFSARSTLVSWMRGNNLFYTEVWIFLRWVCMVRDYPGLLQRAETPPKRVLLLKRHLIETSDIVPIAPHCRLQHFLELFFFILAFFFNPNKYLIRMIGFEPEKRGSRWELPQSFPHLFTTSSRKQLWSFVTSTESRIETALRFVFPLRLAGLYLSQVHPGEEQTLSTAISLWSLLERRKPWILTWMEQALHPTCVINTTEALQLEHATSLTAWATKGTEASAPGSCTSLLNPGKNWSIHLTSG